MSNFSIPDYLSPLVAYRTWYWEGGVLSSLNHVEWTPGQPLTAECARFDAGCPHPPEIPYLQCTCGVYAAKNFPHLVKIGYHEHGIHGECLLWGRVVDHHLGYRAQFAYPKNFVIPEDLMPFKVTDVLSSLQALQLFGVDIYFMRSRTNFDNKALIWSKDTGIIGTGMAELMDRRARWYEKHKKNPALEVGDRVFIKNKGIGIVNGIEKISGVVDTMVTIMLAGNCVSMLKLEDISWEERNNRWTADAGFERQVPIPMVATGLRINRWLKDS